MPELNELGIDDKRNTRARFEQWVKNPQCEANALSAVLNVKMNEVQPMVARELIPPSRFSQMALKGIDIANFVKLVRN